jgi:hypothetical protein
MVLATAFVQRTLPVTQEQMAANRTVDRRVDNLTLHSRTVSVHIQTPQRASLVVGHHPQPAGILSLIPLRHKSFY